MRYTSISPSTLFVKLVLVKRPYSDEPVNYLLIADTYRAIKVTTAPYRMHIPLESFNAELVPLQVESMRKKYNFADVQFVAK